MNQINQLEIALSALSDIAEMLKEDHELNWDQCVHLAEITVDLIRDKE